MRLRNVTLIRRGFDLIDGEGNEHEAGAAEGISVGAESGATVPLHAFDELPDRSGQLTSAAAMGDMLLTRLQAAGIAFRVVEESS